MDDIQEVNADDYFEEEELDDYDGESGEFYDNEPKN